MSAGEVDNEGAKLQQHLRILKQQYANLNNHCTELEKKYNILCAATAKDGDLANDSFAARLMRTVSSLHLQEMYSDLKIKLQGCEVPGHRLVFSARFNQEKEFSSELDWTQLNVDVAKCILHWIYTDELLDAENLMVEMMRSAYKLKLVDLVIKCERKLTSKVTLRNCVLLYSVSDEVDASALRELCSNYISTYWSDLTSADFEHMSGPLLFKMLKSKTDYPLQSAVRLMREDVVFLCLLEDNDRNKDVVNSWSPKGELALDLALRAQNSSIARTLLEHEADVNIRDSKGDTLLHRAFTHNDTFAIKFLLENGANINLTTSESNESNTALHILAKYGPERKDTVEEFANLLLAKPSLEVNRRNGLGLTPLSLSIQSDNSILFQLLLKHPEVDVNAKCNLQHSVLYYALIKFNGGTQFFAMELLKHRSDLDCCPVYTKDNCNCLMQRLIEERAPKAAELLCGFLDSADDTGVNYVNESGESSLHLSCKEMYPDLTEKLIKQGARVDQRTKDMHQTPLHYTKCAECIRKFLKTDADFNAKDANGDTPLSLALNSSPRCDLEVMSALIEGKADVNARNSKDYSLLHQAIADEDAERAIFLLDAGADVNALSGSDLETPLHLAIACRLPQVVQVLCVKGVNMGAVDRNGACPLWSALEAGMMDIAQVLVRNGADLDCWQEQRSLLHRAIDENNEAAAQFLVQAGCDLDAPTSEGCAPLHLCCSWGLESTVRCLIEHGANVNARDAENKTPIHHAILNCYSAIVSLLLCHPNIDLSLRDAKGVTPFAQALTLRNNEAAKWILDKYPAAAEQFDAKGMNFLHTAIKRDDLENVLFLLSVQVDVNSRVQDPTLTPPLHLAAAGGNETLIRSLLLAGARIDERDAYKQTALHVAAQWGHAQSCLALVQNAADFDAADMNGDNALHVAVREGHLQTVRVLLTESHINAEALNLKGRNPLHELSRCPKDNAAAICELFLECMPEYPVNKPDLEGNTSLLLAYMKGHGGLCRVLVGKGNASLAAENLERVTIFNYQVATKQLLYRLLDQLSQQSPWTQTPTQCQECGKGFTITVRKHHCRHCGRALCSRCSDEEVPIIKFGENKPVRVCKICFDVLKVGSNIQ